MANYTGKDPRSQEQSLRRLLPTQANYASRAATARRVLPRALEAVEYLIEAGGYIECTKAEFALRLSWTKPGPGAVDSPDRKMVEDVCNLTREQEDFPFAAEMLAGYVVSYAPNTGGMKLVDPEGELPLTHMMHMLLGLCQQQNGVKTTIRRKQYYWGQAADAAASTGDRELSKVLTLAEDSIKRTGFVSDELIVQIFQMAAVRGILEGIQ